MLSTILWAVQIALLLWALVRSRGIPGLQWFRIFLVAALARETLLACVYAISTEWYNSHTALFWASLWVIWGALGSVSAEICRRRQQSWVGVGLMLFAVLLAMSRHLPPCSIDTGVSIMGSQIIGNLLWVLALECGADGGT
jgi:hypothetical protein